MNLSERWQTIKIGSNHVEMRRMDGGVVDIRADNPLDLQRGLGFAHAVDRLMQMLVMRIVGRGELTQFLLDNDEGYALDVLVRKLGFRRDVVQDLHQITPEGMQWLQAYCEGVNAYLEKEGLPFLCKFFNVKTELWHLTDPMLIVKTLSYLGIAQQQERIERLVIHAIRDDVAPDKLKKLFSPYLDHLDEESISLIKKVHASLPYFDRQMRFEPFKTPMSNNWVIGPKKTASGAPFLCMDPHLQVNRLPSMWYEVCGQWGEGHYQMGITIPGFPGWIMARTPHLTASFTYGLLDTTDFFIEEVKNGQCRRANAWVPLTVREERVHRKRKGQKQLYYFESDTGVIERTNPESPLIDDGLYFSFAWSSFRQGPSPIINCLKHLWSCESVDEAQMYLWAMPLPANWVVADSQGNIGFQQSGRLPIRQQYGLLPLPAWDEKNLWKGCHLGTDLFAEVNPDRGFAASANDNKNQPGKPAFTTLQLPDYRYRRICDLLSQDKLFTLDDMKALQLDNYSIQAEKIMHLIREWIPDTEVGQILKGWDFYYRKDAQAPTLFEAVYVDLMHAVFSPVFGKEAWEVYGPGHVFFGLNFGQFDDILLSEDPSWFGEEGKKTLFKRVVEEALSRFEAHSILPWGEENAFNMNYLLFDGKLPKFFGFDIGPICLSGSRASIDTFQVFLEGKRKLISSATYRFITDMGEHAIHTVLAGGVSEKKRSPYYTSDIALWKSGKYKQLTFDPGNMTFLQVKPFG